MTINEGAFSDGAAIQREFEKNNDPVTLFKLWMAAAEEHEPNDPNAMTLATVDRSGMPNARIILLKDVGSEGFTFYTNFESAKGRELEASPRAALCFHWKSLRRQIRARGNIGPVNEAEANDYFASRPRGSQIGAWASDQSRPLTDRQKFEDAIIEYENKFEGQDVSRPPHWSGYRLTPIEIEFWQSRPSRLHDRVRFFRENNNESWSKTLLYP